MEDPSPAGLLRGQLPQTAFWGRLAWVHQHLICMAIHPLGHSQPPQKPFLPWRKDQAGVPPSQCPHTALLQRKDNGVGGGGGRVWLGSQAGGNHCVCGAPSVCIASALAAEWAQASQECCLSAEGPGSPALWPARHILAQPESFCHHTWQAQGGQDESRQVLAPAAVTRAHQAQQLSLHTVQHQRTPPPGRPQLPATLQSPVGLSDSSKRGQAIPTPEAICSQPKVARRCGRSGAGQEGRKSAKSVRWRGPCPIGCGPRRNVRGCCGPCGVPLQDVE